jgi:hypothetical protein
MLAMNDGETYLGDGLYVSYDGWMIKLRAPRGGENHWVGLEPEVLVEFLRYVDTLRKESLQEMGRRKDQAMRGQSK